MQNKLSIKNKYQQHSLQKQNNNKNNKDNQTNKLMRIVKGNQYYQSTIYNNTQIFKKNGNIVIDTDISNMVGFMIDKQMNRIKYDKSYRTSSCRHMCCLIQGQSNWREKRNYRGKFSKRGIFRMLLWDPCRNGCNEKTLSH